MSTTTTRGYFVDADANGDSALWFGTGPDDPNSRLVATEGTTLPPRLPAPLFELVATALDPTDDDVDQLAEALWQRMHADKGWNDTTPVNRDYYRFTVRSVLAVLASGVLA